MDHIYTRNYQTLLHQKCKIIYIMSMFDLNRDK